MAHELILGALNDFITGETLPDTLDERARQEIARFLVEQKGYEKSDISARVKIPLEVDGDTGISIIDYLVSIRSKGVMAVVFGPGSLVTRERAAVTAAMLAAPFIIPYVVVTNGKDAEFMDTHTGKVIGYGFESIISRQEMINRIAGLEFTIVEEKRRKKAERILFTLDVLTRRECDEFTCTRC
ncbi:MAG: type I restriction enzyme HsdR N-terminal domain-containing protein [Deltaproteobacteria bacterium]|nr:type I restriction enzyme HsdR N-terminal domain-containing protein [Deltaproteobacteria bacterium]